MVVKLRGKRWLSQFVKNQDSKAFVFGNNISAISGATISVQSMTVCQSRILFFERAKDCRT